jgi:hypothetical protein
MSSLWLEFIEGRTDKDGQGGGRQPVLIGTSQTFAERCAMLCRRAASESMMSDVEHHGKRVFEQPSYYTQA